MSYPDWKKEAVASGFTGKQTDRPLSMSAMKRHRRAYFATLSYTDSLVKQILDTLDDTGLAASTVVTLFSGT
jgi:arylsulfatase A-like enzyme